MLKKFLVFGLVLMCLFVTGCGKKLDSRKESSADNKAVFYKLDGVWKTKEILKGRAYGGINSEPKEVHQYLYFYADEVIIFPYGPGLSRKPNKYEIISDDNIYIYNDAGIVVNYQFIDENLLVFGDYLYERIQDSNITVDDFNNDNIFNY